jgi:hypothetical protein
MTRLVLAALLCASTGCIITEDGKGSGLTLELSWLCPADADELSLMAWPLEGDVIPAGAEGVPDTLACDQPQPARFLYDPGDWYVEATPQGSRDYYTDWGEFGGEDMDVAALDFAFEDHLAAFKYSWRIGGINPTTGCDSKGVTEVTITAAVEADPGVTFDATFPCEIGEGQSQPLPLDNYLLSASPDGGTATAVADIAVVDEPSGLVTLPEINIAVE